MQPHSFQDGSAIRRTIIVAGILATAALTTGYAQPTQAPPNSSCSDTTGGADYARCALWFDGHNVHQGANGRVVAQPGYWSPMQLTHLVVGDSAQRYALAYEHEMRAAQTLWAVGTGLSVAAAISMGSYECGTRFATGGCSNGDDGHYMTAAALFIGSEVLLAVKGRVAHAAERAAEKAVWWHNARFGGR